MAASYSILMVRGKAEIGNSYDAQPSDGSSSVSRPCNIQTANINGGSPSSERADHAWERFSRKRPVRVVYLQRA